MRRDEVYTNQRLEGGRMILEERTFIIQCDLCQRKLDPVVVLVGEDVVTVEPPKSWTYREHANLFMTQYLCCPSCKDLKLPEVE